MSYGTIQAEKMTTESGYSLGAGNASSFKNRLINGRMEIDQRNAGASASNLGGQFTYFLDRWGGFNTDASKFTVQQNAGSVTPPAGFRNYLGITSSSAFSLGTSSQFQMGQAIEGYNMADFGWGTSSAKDVTLSFWVRSSLTGTFAVSIRNDGMPSWRSYLATFTINSANTWEQKTITVTGDTGGTWNSTNGAGIYLVFCLGAGSTFTTSTTGSWIGSNFINVTGANNLVSTNGATLYITGVQLEVGTVATSFDFRSIGTELALCQRYFISLGGDSAYQGFAAGIAGSTTSIFYTLYNLPVSMRSSPSVAISGAFRVDDGYSASFNVTGVGTSQMGTSVGLISVSVASGLTAGRFYQLQANNSTASRLQFSSEI